MSIIKQTKIIKDQKNTKDLQLNQQQLSHIVASLLLLSFFIFMAGYYWGKKNTLEPFSDSLADQVSYGFCSLYDFQEDDNDDASESKEESTEETQSQGVTLNSCSQDVENNDIIKKIDEVKIVDVTYSAQLFGSNSLKPAQACANLLKKNGFDVVVVTRVSKTASGKNNLWYQVVTIPVENKKKLSEQVEQMKKLAKLKDVQIKKNNIKKDERP